MFKYQKIPLLKITNFYNSKLSTLNLAACQEVKSFEEIPQIPRKNSIQRFQKTIKKFVFQEQLNLNYERDDYFSVLYKRYGTIVKDPRSNIVHLFDPKDVETLFKNESRFPTRYIFKAVDVVRARNKENLTKFSILLNNGNDWFNLRSKMSSYVFKPQTIQNICPSFNSVAVDFVNNISALKNEDDHIEHLFDWLCKWAFENTGLLVFGKRLGSLNLSKNEAGSDSIRFVAALDILLTTCYKLDLGFPWYKWFSTPMYKIVEENYKTLIKIACKYVYQNIDEIRTKSESGSQGGLLSYLLARKEVDDDEVISTVSDLLMGGTDSTAGLMSMLLYHLAKHPIQQQKLYEEIQQFIKNPDEIITVKQLQLMSYLKACIKETHRLTPIIDSFARILHKDHVFSGYNIPTGTEVVVHHRVMGKIHFENSKAFEPERWLNGKNTHHPFSWLPFSHGTRSCVGQKVAQLEVLLLVIKVLQKYKLTCDGEHRVTTTSLMVNKPSKDLKFKFIHR